LIDAAPDALIVVDERGMIRVANRQAAILFGYPEAELLGSSVEMLVPEALRAAHAEHRGVYGADPKTRHMESGLKLTARRKDGTAMPVDIALSSIRTPSGRLTSASIRDISARVEAETERQRITEELHQARLRQAQRLETVGQLAGGIAHDFNNLLAVILNYADFLAEQLPPGEMRQDVEEIQRAATRAANLTRQLLIFARREVAAPEVLDLNAVISGVENVLRRTLGEDIALKLVLADRLPSVRADPGQMEQVFLNLAVNARDAMPRGGQLVVETAAEELDEVYVTAHPNVAPGRYVRLSVSDTGTGMSPEVVARAFDPFFTTKAPGHGTGLGLATVYGIVVQAGGDVAIYSEPGLGTRVSMHLPAVDEPPAVTSVAAPEPAVDAAEDRTVLIVEDEDAVLVAAARILTGHGYKVVTHADPSDALKLLADRDVVVDILVTDIVMPEVSGFDLARQAQELRPSLRVLFMTGYAEELVMRRGKIPAGSRVLQKPFTRRGLLDAVGEALRPSGHDA